MFSVLWLGGCGFEPPLAFDGLVVGVMTFDQLDGDLKFQVDDEGEAGSVESLDYTMAVEGTPVYEDVYEGTDQEVDGGVVLAPVKVAYGDVFEVDDLFRTDDVIPFEITGHYLFDASGVHLEYTLVQTGELPAPRAPVFVATRLSRANVEFEVVNDNVDDVEITLLDYTIEVDGRQVGSGDWPSFPVPGERGEVTIALPLDPGSGWDGRTVAVRLRSEAVVETIFGEIPLSVDTVGDLGSPR